MDQAGTNKFKQKSANISTVNFAFDTVSSIQHEFS